MRQRGRKKVRSVIYHERWHKKNGATGRYFRRRPSAPTRGRIDPGNKQQIESARVRRRGNGDVGRLVSRRLVSRRLVTSPGRVRSGQRDHHPSIFGLGRTAEKRPDSASRVKRSRISELVSALADGRRVLGNHEPVLVVGSTPRDVSPSRLRLLLRLTSSAGRRYRSFLARVDAILTSERRRASCRAGRTCD